MPTVAAVSRLTARERWLAALRMEPVDRLPFWPKLDAAYAPARRPPFRDMSTDQLHTWIGSEQHVGLAPAVREVRSVTGLEVERHGDLRHFVRTTPYGPLTRVDRWDEASRSWHPVEFPLRSVDDVEVLTSWYQDGRPELDPAGLEQARTRVEAVGDSGTTFACIGESALMHLVEWLAGIEHAHYLLHDHPAEVGALFEAIHDNLLRRAEIMAEHHPADALYLIENTSTTLISVDQYRRWCLPHLLAYAELLRAAGRPLILHMCGHLKALLPDLARLPVAAFEAFTSPPVGNTTLLDGRLACPHTCLVGGTNATLWLKPAERIIAEIEAHLGSLPHHRGLVVTSAGVMPPWAEPETIREVCRWVHAYPARM